MCEKYKHFKYKSKYLELKNNNLLTLTGGGNNASTSSSVVTAEEYNNLSPDEKKYYIISPTTYTRLTQKEYDAKIKHKKDLEEKSSEEQKKRMIENIKMIIADQDKDWTNFSLSEADYNYLQQFEEIKNLMDTFDWKIDYVGRQPFLELEYIRGKSKVKQEEYQAKIKHEENLKKINTLGSEFYVKEFENLKKDDRYKTDLAKFDWKMEKIFAVNENGDGYESVDIYKNYLK